MTGDRFPLYQRLANNVANARAVKINEKSSNIKELIIDEYKKITSSVTFKSNHTSADESDLFDVKFQVVCPGSTRLEDKNSCDNLRVNDEVEYAVTIMAKKCSKQRQYIGLQPEAFSERLTVEIDVNCECNCTDTVKKSPYCRGKTPDQTQL